MSEPAGQVVCYADCRIAVPSVSGKEGVVYADFSASSNNIKATVIFRLNRPGTVSVSGIARIEGMNTTYRIIKTSNKVVFTCEMEDANGYITECDEVDITSLVHPNWNRIDIETYETEGDEPGETILKARAYINFVQVGIPYDYYKVVNGSRIHAGFYNTAYDDDPYAVGVAAIAVFDSGSIVKRVDFNYNQPDGGSDYIVEEMSYAHVEGFEVASGGYAGEPSTFRFYIHNYWMTTGDCNARSTRVDWRLLKDGNAVLTGTYWDGIGWLEISFTHEAGEYVLEVGEFDCCYYHWAPPNTFSFIVRRKPSPSTGFHGAVRRTGVYRRRLVF